MPKNIFYFRYICAIGGTEQFLYEMAKKYGNKYDIEVQYQVGDIQQLKRLSKFVRCRQWHKGEIVECDKYFANFNTEQLKYVKAKEYYFCVHANFLPIGYHPNMSDFDGFDVKFIAVSKWARDKFIEFTGKDCDYCYNPLTIEPKEKVMHLVSACRLDDVVKGGERIKKLIEALDKYCSATGRHYIWTIFTNSISNYPSKNVAIMPPRTDVRPYIQDADIVLQLSNDMETYCYTTNEAWSYGVHTITTPLSVNKELPIPKEANYVLEYDCSNIDDVVRHIFEDELKPFSYQPPKDDWTRYLAKGGTNYQKELKNMKKAIVLVESLIINRLNKTFFKGDIVELTDEELTKALAVKFVEAIEPKKEVKEKEVEVRPEPKKEVKKAVRKTTKK